MDASQRANVAWQSQSPRRRRRVSTGSSLGYAWQLLPAGGAAQTMIHRLADRMQRHDEHLQLNDTNSKRTKPGACQAHPGVIHTKSPPHLDNSVL